MSFSSDIKQELNKNSNLSNKDIVKYEAEVIPLETLSQLMSIFLAHGVI